LTLFWALNINVLVQILSEAIRTLMERRRDFRFDAPTLSSAFIEEEVPEV